MTKYRELEMMNNLVAVTMCLLLL